MRGYQGIAPFGGISRPFGKTIYFALVLLLICNDLFATFITKITSKRIDSHSVVDLVKMDNCYSFQSQPTIGDVLGNEGRKALDACVKVKIYGPPETRRYDWHTALDRLKGCYSGVDVTKKLYHIIFDEHTLPPEFDKEWNNYTSKTYTIVDIGDALVKFDDISYVEKYPKEGPGSEKTRELIDKRRADVERELKEATANPDSRQRYSWTVAQRRVRDCYAGNFPGDSFTLKTNHKRDYNIKDIHDALDYRDKGSLETCSYQNRCKYEEIYAHRADVEKEYEEAIASTGTLHKYAEDEAEQRLRDCYCGTDGPQHIGNQSFSGYSGRGRDAFISIFDIHSQLRSRDRSMQQLCKYPEEGPGSEELKKLIDAHRADLEVEYQNFVKGDKPKLPVREYCQQEAERRVRDCFAGTFKGDVDIFPTKKEQCGLPKIYQTFDIFDIKQSLDYFDAKKLLEKYPEKGYKYDERKQFVEEQRASIQSEYEIATTTVEIEHGSGFIIQDHFILTNKHVIETYLNEKDSYEVHISNSSIGRLSCNVAFCDPGKDLALLYCPDLNLLQSGICSLQLSTQPLLPGMQIFSFGYLVSHTEETALFVSGNVSGSKETLSGHSMVVLNCSLNSGNSGGPVLSWLNGQLKVVGIATQKHIKEILTYNERMAIEKIRESLQTCAISAEPDYVEPVLVSSYNVQYVQSNFHPTHRQNAMDLLTLKLYDALETHSQFNLSNALPGHLVVEFIKNCITEYRGECKEELAKMVILSQ